MSHGNGNYYDTETFFCASSPVVKLRRRRWTSSPKWSVDLKIILITDSRFSCIVFHFADEKHLRHSIWRFHMKDGKENVSFMSQWVWHKSFPFVKVCKIGIIFHLLDSRCRIQVKCACLSIQNMLNYTNSQVAWQGQSHCQVLCFNLKLTNKRCVF